jgi:hypothetical protein
MKQSVLVSFLVVLVACMLLPYPGHGRGGSRGGGSRGGGFSHGYSGGHSGLTGHQGLRSSSRTSSSAYRPFYSSYRPPYSSYRASYQPYRRTFPGYRPFYNWGYRPFWGVSYPWWGFYSWDPFYYPYNVPYDYYGGDDFPDTELTVEPDSGPVSNPSAYADPSFRTDQGYASQGTTNQPGQWIQVPAQWVGGTWVPSHAAWVPTNP